MKTARSAWLGLLLAALAVGAGEDPPKPDPSADEAAIRAAVGGFARAFQAGDAAAIAALFTEDGEAVDVEGHAIQGRRALEEHYAARFAENPGQKLEGDVETIKLLAPGAARVTGRSRLVPTEGEEEAAPAASRGHSAFYVNQGGKWLLASVRELHDKELTPHDHLMELEWLVGDWVEETEDAVVLTSVAWTDRKNFLLRSYDVRVKGKPALTGTQRIGWDPLTRQIKSWVFDDLGGHGEGLWMRSGPHWIIKATGVRPDGHATTATQVLTYLGKDQLRWKSIDRTQGSDVVEEIAEVVMVRKPPPPR